MCYYLPGGEVLPCLTGWEPKETKLDWVRFIALALVIFPSFLVTKVLNLFNCLSLTLLNLISLTLFMKSWHSLNLSAEIIEVNLALHSSVCFMTWSKMLLMALTLAWSKSFSAFLIICLALEVVKIDFSLMLTGINYLCRHLREKILWFLYSEVLSRNLSHSLNKCRASIPYSWSNIRCRFLILLNKSCRRLVFFGTVHWFWSKTRFQLLQ